MGSIGGAVRKYPPLFPAHVRCDFSGVCPAGCSEGEEKMESVAASLFLFVWGGNHDIPV